jgi:hypothetical protein
MKPPWCTPTHWTQHQVHKQRCHYSEDFNMNPNFFKNVLTFLINRCHFRQHHNNCHKHYMLLIFQIYSHKWITSILFTFIKKINKLHPIFQNEFDYKLCLWVLLILSLFFYFLQHATNKNIKLYIPTCKLLQGPQPTSLILYFQ